MYKALPLGPTPAIILDRMQRDARGLTWAMSVIHPVIVPVKCFLPDHDSGPDCRVKLLAAGCHHQVFIEVVHDWDDKCYVRCSVMREEQSCIFENL